VTTYERDPEFAEVARENMRLAGVADRVEVRTGDLTEELERLVDASDGTGRGVVETITGETGGERLALSALSAEGVDAAVGAAREI